ncbi:inositol monophosphatase family protein [Peterkaempfera sp. SMS 1(5)a]|uniref:inositol monophosphatase family protein n=1 Tax=Peterkaempfera podocarpi TaxID=3232308 RepID=UPI00366D49F2
MPNTPDLMFAHRLADQAADIARRHRRAGATATQIKSDGSPVSAADREIEQALRQRIHEQHPNDAIIGEEYGSHGQGHRRWIIDAIDGTASFLAGEPEWSTLIALEVNHRITLGMVSAPALNRRWWAAPNQGAWTSSLPSPRPCTSARRLAISEGSAAADSSLGIWPPPRRLNPTQRAIAAALATRTARTTPTLNWSTADSTAPTPKKPSTGSGTCHGALLVVTGRLDAFLLLGAGPWDIAALIPIVQEAGGIFSDLSGQQRTDTGGALFARPGLHQQLLDIAASAR